MTAIPQAPIDFIGILVGVFLLWLFAHWVTRSCTPQPQTPPPVGSADAHPFASEPALSFKARDIKLDPNTRRALRLVPDFKAFTITIYSVSASGLVTFVAILHLEQADDLADELLDLSLDVACL